MPRFKVDENLPVEVAEVLREAGHDAVSVLDQAMGGRADPDVANVCRGEDRTIIKLDRGFADIRAYPPGEYSGIIVLRLRKQDKPHVTNIVRMLLPLLKEESPEGTLWITDETSVRIRRENS